MVSAAQSQKKDRGPECATSIGNEVTERIGQAPAVEVAPNECLPAGWRIGEQVTGEIFGNLPPDPDQHGSSEQKDQHRRAVELLEVAYEPGDEEPSDSESAGDMEKCVKVREPLVPLRGASRNDARDQDRKHGEHGVSQWHQGSMPEQGAPGKHILISTRSGRSPGPAGHGDIFLPGSVHEHSHRGRVRR